MASFEKPVRGLHELTNEEFAAMDVATIILQNYRRYIGVLTASLGSLSASEIDDLPGTYWEQGRKPIAKIKSDLVRKNSAPEERRRAILGTLKSMTLTRVKAAIVEERTKFSNESSQWVELTDTHLELGTEPADDDIYFAAEALSVPDGDEDHGFEAMQLLETTRVLFTKNQHSALKARLSAPASHKTVDLLEDLPGYKPRQVNDHLKHARLKMFDLVPSGCQKATFKALPPINQKEVLTTLPLSVKQNYFQSLSLRNKSELFQLLSHESQDELFCSLSPIAQRHLVGHYKGSTDALQ